MTTELSKVHILPLKFLFGEIFDFGQKNETGHFFTKITVFQSFLALTFKNRMISLEPPKTPHYLVQEEAAKVCSVQGFMWRRKVSKQCDNEKSDPFFLSLFKTAWV